jgi:hypothetical protein
VVKKTADIRSLARGYTDVCMRTLGGWATADEGVDPEIKIRAIGMLLDRGWGKPNQPTENKIEGEVNIILRDMMAERAKKK